MMDEEKPYLIEEKVVVLKRYNPNYGDQRTCVCEHPYERHFDSYEGMDPVGCKYCACDTFKEDTKSAPSLLAEPDYDPGRLHSYRGPDWEAWHNYIRNQVDSCNAYWRNLIESHEK